MNKSVMTAVHLILVIALSTAAVIGVTRVLGGPSLSISQITTNKESTFDVTGESKINTTPDEAEVRLGITVTQSSVKATQDQANSVINDINAKLGEMGIGKNDIKTENYSLYPNYDFQSGTQRITGYSLNANLVITMKDFAQVNQVIDMATGAGANQIGGITFTLSDEKRKEVEKVAREEAIEDAKQKARELADIAGMKLGKIVNVTEVPTTSTLPPLYREAALSDAMGGAGGAPTNVEPGSTSFNYSVTLSYETL